MQRIGFGDKAATLNVYLENRPPLPQYQQLATHQAISAGEIHQISEQTGNHWRKIFNVYAKLIFELTQPNYRTWQDYREQELLQAGSKTGLWFSPIHIKNTNASLNNDIHIIMGKTYATKLGYAEQCHWLSTDFALSKSLRMIICPYFDYRQLSNIKITQLCALIKQLDAS